VVSEYRPDETVRCEKCGSPLKYDKFFKHWRETEEYPDIAKCFNKKLQRYDHVPKANVSRLLRAAKRWNERKFHVE